jgi:hypothetical protein
MVISLALLNLSRRLRILKAWYDATYWLMKGRVEGWCTVLWIVRSVVSRVASCPGKRSVPAFLR